MHSLIGEGNIDPITFFSDDISSSDGDAVFPIQEDSLQTISS
jgi:hypothetical protein